MNYIVTHCCPRSVPVKQIFDLTSKHNKDCADGLGWGFFGDSKRRVPDKDSSYERFAMLAEIIITLKDDDKILWIEGGSLIVGKNTPAIFEELGSEDIGMIKKGPNWDRDVLAIAVNQITKKFLPEIRDNIYNPSKRTCAEWDKYLCDNCRVPIWRRRLLCGSTKSKITEISKKWNDDEIRQDTEIYTPRVSFTMGKLSKIKEFLEKK